MLAVPFADEATDRGASADSLQRGRVAGMTEEIDRGLVVWLGEENFSQLGECKGKALDVLISKGFAQIHELGEHQGGFISRGDGSGDYRAVSLTEAGREFVASLKGAR